MEVVKDLEATLRAAIAGHETSPEIAPIAALVSGLDAAPREERARRVQELIALATGEAPAPPALRQKKPSQQTLPVAAPAPAAGAPKKKRSPKPAAIKQAAALNDKAGLGLLPLSAIEGVGPSTAAKLGVKGVDTVLDALLWLPRRYEDRRTITPISQLRPGEFAIVRGKVVHAAPLRLGKSGKPMFEVALTDGSGTLSLRWFRFHGEAMKKRFVRDKEFVVSGTVTAWGAMKQIVHPETEAPDRYFAEENSGIAPVYPEIDGLRPKQLRTLLQDIARRFSHRLPDPLPPAIREKRGLPALARAIAKAHLPETLEPGEDPDRAVRHRLVYDELFFFQLLLAQRQRSGAVAAGLSNVSPETWPSIAKRMLPFAPTRAQLRAIEEIARDLARPSPMNRLLQGDVGSGKTAVAMVAAAIVAGAKRQVAILAPTEILAEQHAITGARYLQSVGLRHALLTGSTKTKDRRTILDALASRSLDVIIGTHALLEPDVVFAELGLAIIDEQHRFGVEQRAALRAKNKGLTPDVLVMTATPIPRTLALTLYGDLDVSVLDERPPGRTPITTRVLKDVAEAYRLISTALSSGRQAYVVFPLVEASEVMDLRAATDAVEEIRKQYPSHNVGLLHGRMRGEEKSSVMDAFRRGEIHVLVSTTVIEVGVDVPNATVMVVENAERFGLSQIHQLRGRVGRGEHPGTCLLIAGAGGEQTWSKLAVLEQSDDGFKVAQADLELRGPGEILGTRQSGLAALAMADLVRDAKVLEEARADAFEIVAQDPELARPEHRALAEEVKRRMKGAMAFAEIA